MAKSVSRKSDNIRKDVEKVLRVVLPLGVSAVLVVWLLHKVDFRQIGTILSQGVDWWWIIIAGALTLLSHAIRGVRWGIQLRAAGIQRVPVTAECVSIFGAYALNLLVPYMGEAWRCVYMTRRGKAKLSTVVGTDFGDRISDAVVIVALIILSLFVARPYLMRFLEKYPLGKDILTTVTDGTMWIWVAAVVIIVAAAAYMLRHTKFMAGVKTSTIRIWQGFAVLFHMKGIGLYIVLTLGIWTCYFLETYLCFFAFPFTRELITHGGYAWGLVPGLVAFVFGSISIAVPSNGGLGPWNIAVMFALTLFGIRQADAAAFSLIAWSAQTVANIIGGIFSAFYVMKVRS